MSGELERLISGFRASQAIHAAATLGIADLLAAGGRTSDDLAHATEADPSALYRLLRALASLGVLVEADERTFSLTPIGDRLRRDAPGSLHGWAILNGRDYFWRAWGNLTDSIRTGESSFRSMYGTSLWEWRAQRPEESFIFDQAMTALTAASNSAILAAYHFGRFGTVVDVGGGNGTLLASLLTAHPTLRGVLFDQPHVVTDAQSMLSAAGVLDRATIVPGSSFEEIPHGGDAYVLKSIVHDWGDDEATAILRSCRAAMSPSALLLLVERDLGGPNENAEAKLSDLNMLVLLGGRERTIDEYAGLLSGAGLHLEAVHPTARGHLVIEAKVQ